MKITRRAFFGLFAAAGIVARSATASVARKLKPVVVPAYPRVYGANQAGPSLNTHGWAQGAKFPFATEFEIEGVFSVNPITLCSTGHRLRFISTVERLYQ